MSSLLTFILSIVLFLISLSGVATTVIFLSSPLAQALAIISSYFSLSGMLLLGVSLSLSGADTSAR